MKTDDAKVKPATKSSSAAANTCDMNAEKDIQLPDVPAVVLQSVVVPRYATSLESTLLALAHTAAFALLAAYDWKLATAYILHTLACIWRSPMIWKRHNAELCNLAVENPKL